MLTLNARIIFLFVAIYCCSYAARINVVSVVMAFRIQQQQQQYQPPPPVSSLSFRKIRTSIVTVGGVPSSALYMAAGGRGMSKNAKTSNNEKSTTTGMGMGMGSTTMKSKDNKKGTSSSSGSTPFNVNASLARLEKKYDELTKANAKVIRKKDDKDDDDDDDSNKDDTTIASTTNSSSNNDDDDDDDDDDNKIVTSEYVVAIRAEGYVDDWVPIAQFCLTRTSKQASKSDGVTDPAIQAGVSYYCRELSHVATLGSRIFQSIPRNVLQYSIETLDSFHKHVYETTISTNGGSNKNDDPTNTNTMTKQDAREVLELVNGDADDKSAIKRAYRTKSFEYHPDRFIGIDRTSDEIEMAHNKYLRIQLAYDTLNSGIRSTNSTSTISWYQSLGGKARTDFVGPISLLPIETGKSILEMNQIESAITCMSPSIVQTFVARCK